MAATRIVLLEDHVVVRRALAALLEAQDDLRVVGEAGSARELALVTESLEFDLLIVDLALPGPSGLSTIVELRRRVPAPHVLVLTMYADEFRAAESFASGADGYAVKVEAPEAIVGAVRAVLAGKRYLSPLIDLEAVEQLLYRCKDRMVVDGPLAPLSRREREIFDLMIRGHSCRQIGAMLFISPRTVDTHRARIFGKLRVHSQAELLRFAVRFGMLGDDMHSTG
jgi:DNA-binding NarL/FixJ family response regulator